MGGQYQLIDPPTVVSMIKPVTVQANATKRHNAVSRYAFSLLIGSPARLRSELCGVKVHRHATRPRDRRSARVDLNHQLTL